MLNLISVTSGAENVSKSPKIAKKYEKKVIFSNLCPTMSVLTTGITFNSLLKLILTV